MTDRPTGLAWWSAVDLAAAIASSRLSPVEVVDAYLDRLGAFDATLRSHATICRDAARVAAREAERAVRAGAHLGPLHGVPLSHKDNLLTRGVRTTCHSRTSFNRVPDEDATAVARLGAAGAILLGKTNTTEFACGDQLLQGDTPNPWDVALHSGASSAGSASAVAAGLTAAATGSDTGGSIRAPAALCGVVGVKPTYGRVSRHGLVPLAWSMDHVGPIARSVADAALLLRSMAGRDPRDPTSAAAPVPDYPGALTDRLDGVRVGVPLEHYFDGLEPDVDRAVKAALALLEELGARLVPLSLPSAGDLAAAGSLLSMWEAFTLHAASLRREGRAYGPKARAYIASGGFHAAAEVAHALQLRAAWAREVAAAFELVDVVATPTLPFTAVTRVAWIVQPPDTSWATRGFSLTGHPALTQPCGFDALGRPIGLQLAARHFDETTMLRVAHAYERAAGWHRRRPDEAAWSRPTPGVDAKARVAPVDPETGARLRAEAERLGLPLDDHDLARAFGLVDAARRSLARLRPERTIDLEPTWVAGAPATAGGPATAAGPTVAGAIASPSPTDPEGARP